MKTKRKNEVNPLKWNVRNVWKRFNRKMKYLRKYLNINLVKNKTMKYTKKFKRCKNWVIFCCNICKLFLLFDFAFLYHNSLGCFSLCSSVLTFRFSFLFSLSLFFLSFDSMACRWFCDLGKTNASLIDEEARSVKTHWWKEKRPIDRKTD
jgi:hypothetical protein